MVGVGVTKRILRAITDTHPDGSAYEISRVEIKEGWGGVLYVTISGGSDPDGDGRAIREAVERALGSRRHNVRLETTA